MISFDYLLKYLTAAAAAKSLQSCPTLRLHRWQHTRLPCPWDSPGKNTGVGCHFLLQRMKVKRESEVAQLCPTLSDFMDCSLPGSSVHGIFQASVLEWGAIAFSRRVGALVSAKQHKDKVPLLGNQDLAPGYTIISLDSHSLLSHPLPSLINNCLNLLVGTYRRSRRLQEACFL